MKSSTSNQIEGKWLEIKGDIQKAWGKLTDNELDQTKGDAKAIGGLLQQKYGKTVDGYDEKLSEIFNRFDAKKDRSVDRVKTALKN